MSLLEKRRRPIVRDVLGVGFIKLLAIPATLGVAVILARTLGPSDYGTYAFALSLTNVVALFLTGGLAQLVTREVAFALHDDARSLIKGVIYSATAWGLSTSATVTLGTWAVLGFIAPGIDGSFRVALLLGSLALPVLALSPVWSGTLRGYGLSARSQYPGLLLAPLTQLGAVALLQALGLLSVKTAMLTYIAANMVAAAVGLYLMHGTVSSSWRDTVAEYRIASWAKSSGSFTGIALITYLNSQVSVLLLGFASTTVEVAAFQIADRVAQLVILATAIIELVLAPHVAQTHKARTHDRLQGLFKTSRRAGGAFTLLFAFPLIYDGTRIVLLVFGDDYVKLAVQPLAIISFALAIRAFLGPTSTFLSMTGNERSTLAAQGLALLVNIILTLILAPRFGAEGAAWASAAGIITWSGLLALQAQGKLGINIFRL